MRIVTQLSFAAILFVTSVARVFAADMCYSAWEGNSVVGKGANPSDACRDLIAKLGIATYNGHKGGDLGGYCFYYHPAGNLITFGQIDGGKPGTCSPAPGGDTCTGNSPPLTGFGHIKDNTGACVDFTRADTPSQCKSLAGAGTGFRNVQISFDGNGNPQTPPPLTVMGCEAAVLDSSHCKMAPVRCADGNKLCMQSSINKCKVAVTFTGAVGGSGVPLKLSGGPGDDGVCPPGQSCEPLVPPNQNQSSPCNYVADGEGRMVCDSNKWNAVPGQNNCGMVNGKFGCYGKAPTSNGINIGTKITTTPNAGGGSTTTKDDTHTVVKCVGAGSCTTSVTNTKTTVVKNGNGVTTGTTTTCTGPACPSGGNPDGDGDGFGDCVGGEGECSEDGGPSAGTNPELEEVPSFGDSINTFKGKVAGSPIPSALSGFRAPTGGSCPTGTASTFIGDFEYSEHCALVAQQQDLISFVAKLLWSFLALWIFLG